ncbi:pentatricopeptide repeat-containing protein At5g15280, mitochondrial [Durio zibethinus]|uniref:Pentatricopeptide repeat-containing protein At5g15280, mitochondrial n=1 Tax=Durio zibethinus TaxID=66656 RepID=A0A6P6BBN3_DURZI|nr:pentatricopeptide repeat-containing protein At5g15280, mitochondrial [Durio zibethinus]
MRARSSSFTLLFSNILQTLSISSPNKPHLKKVTFLLSPLSTKHNFTSVSDQIKETQINSSSIDSSGIARSIILRCPQLSAKKGRTFRNASLKELMLDISDVIPETARKFRRVSVLKAEDVLEILLGFEFESGKCSFGVRKVGALWEIFKWASEKVKGFKHLPRSCEVMASMLIEERMFKEAELLVLEVEREGILVDIHGIFCSLIEGYVGVSDLESAISVFDKMRKQGLVPSLSCYRAFIDILIARKRTQLAFRVYLDMVEMDVCLSDEEMPVFENVIRLLCEDGRIQEARYLLKKILLGFKPSSLVINEIACAYCEKKDFEDLLRFLVEWKRFPDVIVGNKIIHTLCGNFGVERGDLFLQELELLGFRPNEITFGILIGWSCYEGDLRSAFVYLSQILSRGFKPDLWSYNSLISGVFKEGMWKHAKDILEEMVDGSTCPNLYTYKVLLAGYCKARRFDEAKKIVSQMVNDGLIELSSLEDPLSKAFVVLGLDPLAIRLRRDNDVGFSMAEFFDDLGNGLYLDTDLDEYEKKVSKVLEDSTMPDFNSLIMNEYSSGNFKNAFRLVDEMILWGQEMSISVLSASLKGLGTSLSHSKAVVCLFEKMPKLVNQLDQEVLNMLIQAFCKTGLAYKGMSLFFQMLQRGLIVNSETYTAVMKGLCKRGILSDLYGCWDVARINKWLPALEDCNALLKCLCHQGMLKEALELFDGMLVSNPQMKLELCNIFLENLCISGFVSIAHEMVEELLSRGWILDRVAYSHLVRGLCAEKKFSGAIRVLDSMLAKDLVPCLDVSLTLIPHLCRADKFEAAITLGKISLGEQSAFSSVQRALLKGFCMKGKIGEAGHLFQDISKCLLLDDNIYNMLVQGCCQANNLRLSEELLGVMIRKNICLSIPSYRSWVCMMCSAGRYLSALSLKEFMLGQSQSDSLLIYNILLFYLLSAGNILAVNKVLNELQWKGLRPNEATYDFLVYGFSKCKEVLSAVHYLFTMICKGLRPSSRSLRIVISHLCDLGDLEKALELSREMESRGWIHGSVVQHRIVGDLLSHGKPKEAESFLERMVDKGLIPNTINYDNLIKQFCFYGRLNKAVDLLNIMLKRGNLPDSTSYDSVIHVFCACNKLNRAMDFHNEMLDWDLKPSINTWDMLVCKISQDGRTAEAERLLISMVQLGQTPTKEMYTSVIDRYRSENNLKKASELMQMMQQSGYQPDFDSHWSLISNLSNSRDNNNSSQGFLSRLLSGSGFTWKNRFKTGQQ